MYKSINECTPACIPIILYTFIPLLVYSSIPVYQIQSYLYIYVLHVVIRVETAFAAKIQFSDMPITTYQYSYSALYVET